MIMTRTQRSIERAWLPSCGECMFDVFGSGGWQKTSAYVQRRSPSRASACERVSELVVRLALAEGKYHQVKRMLAAAGNHCTASGSYLATATSYAGFTLRSS